MSGVPNAPKLNGRPKGVQNKTTRQRNELFRQELESTNIIFKAVREINRRLDADPESVRMSELINIIGKVAPFLYQSVSEEKIEDVIATLTTREEAEKEIKSIVDTINHLRAVN